MIHGNLEGIRQSTLDELEKLYDAQFARDEYLPDRLLNALVRFTMQLNRELLVYLDRNGVVLEVAIGSIASISLPELHLRRNLDRLSGYRCIHTHPGGDARLSDVDVQALRLLRFDSMCSVGVAEDRATGIMAAFLGEAEYDRLSIVTFGPVKPGRIPQSLWMREIEAAEERVQRAIERGGLTETAERAMLISTDSEDSLDELAALAETAGALVVSRVLQKRQRPDPGTFIGSGKAEELALDCQALEVDLAILDDELTGAQQRNLENALGVRVIDRTALILDIFAARAQTAEGKLQVELAQMKYRLPRLVGLGQSLSRLGGGIGTRGPGETRLEVDRRRVRKRIDDLEGQLAELKRQRDMRRARREKQDKTVVALVGYTNAGKSTLLNALSGASVLVEDKLFATLDPVMRAVSLPENRECLLVDTVGFIRKLPHQLVEAFHSTLEEALCADLIVVVSDVSSPFYRQQRETVFDVLDQLGAGGKPILEALNKADKANLEGMIEPPGAVLISARTGEGLEALLSEIARRVAALRHPVELLVPYEKGAALSLIHEKGQVLSEEYEADGHEGHAACSTPRCTGGCSSCWRDRAQKALPGHVSEALAFIFSFPGRTEAVLFQKAGHRAGEGIIAAAIEAGNERAEQQRANEADEHVLHGIVDARGQNALQIAPRERRRRPLAQFKQPRHRHGGKEHEQHRRGHAVLLQGALFLQDAGTASAPAWPRTRLRACAPPCQSRGSSGKTPPCRPAGRRET